MKLELTLPLSIRGKPKNVSSTRMLQIVSRRLYEVRSVDDRDVALVFKARFKLGSAFGRDINDVIEFAGNYYRPLGLVDDAVSRYFSSPYSAGINDLHCDQGVNIHFANKVLLRRQLGLQPDKVWPKATATEDWRDFTVLEELLPTLDSIDTEDMVEAEQCLKTAAEGLLIVSGRLWCRTTEPKFTVALEEIVDAYAYRVVVSPWYENPYPCRHYNTTRRLFSLTDEEGAKEYAEALRASFLSKDRKRDILYRAGISAIKEVAPFDGGSEQLRTISRQLAYAVSIRYAKIKHDVNHLTEQQVTLIETATEALLDENYVLGRPFDMSTHVRDLFEIWRALGKPHARDVLGLRTILADSLIEKVIDELEPIAPDFWSKPHLSRGARP